MLSRSLRISCKFFVPRMFRNDVWGAIRCEYGLSRCLFLVFVLVFVLQSCLKVNACDDTDDNANDKTAISGDENEEEEGKGWPSTQWAISDANYYSDTVMLLVMARLKGDGGDDFVTWARRWARWWWSYLGKKSRRVMAILNIRHADRCVWHSVGKLW